MQHLSVLTLSYTQCLVDLDYNHADIVFTTTHQGSFESSLRKGTLAVVSGKLAKQSPEAMKVRTPAAVLGVRGTEFLVRTGDAKD